MSALPRALAAWEGDLDALPRSIALTIAPLLGPLALALGPLASSSRRGSGEPDGVGTLARRGSYERLLASEWALADEMPDEFLRRAGSNEHLFVATSRRASSGSLRSIALFDSGPSQLGSPRIAHVALLIVMARRARQAGARFAWGILGDTSCTLRESVDAAAVRALLDARSALEPTDAWLSSWAERVAPGHDDEPCVIAAPRTTSRLPRGWASIAIVDPLDLDRRTLSVSIKRSRGGGTVIMELALPPDPDCARLLRDPLRAAPTPTASTAVPPGALFGFPSDGRRLAVMTGHELMSWGIGSSPRSSPGSPRHFEVPPNEILFAAGHRGRRLVGIALSLGSPELIVYGGAASSHSGRSRTAVEITTETRDRWLELLARKPLRFRSAVLNVLTAPGHPSVAFVAPDDTLTIISFRPRRPVIQASLPHVLEYHPIERGAIVCTSSPSDGTQVQRVVDGSPELLIAHERTTAIVAHFGSWDGPDGVIAWSNGSRRWSLMSRLRPEVAHIDVPEGARVLGADSGSALVVADSAHRIGLLAAGSRTANEIARARGSIQSGAVAPRGRVVAWATIDGWIEVASIKHREIIFRLPPRAEERT